MINSLFRFAVDAPVGGLFLAAVRDGIVPGYTDQPWDEGRNEELDLAELRQAVPALPGAKTGP